MTGKALISQIMKIETAGDALEVHMCTVIVATSSRHWQELKLTIQCHSRKRVTTETSVASGLPQEEVHCTPLFELKMVVKGL